MIRVGNYRELNPDKYDENWLIVRKPDIIPDFVKHEPLLSPSPELFLKYRKAFHAGLFDRTFFDQVYVPQFLQELADNEKEIELLQALVQESRGKDIFLACYCEDESLCHRSIVAGMLLGMGAEIETVPEYLKYYEMYHEMKMRKIIGNRIIILGCSGSGKSTFARRLFALTHIPLFHLDNIYWNEDRSHLTNEEFDHKVEQILEGDRWIIDGNYPRTYETRIKACDTVIFLDYPKEVCISGITARVGKRHSDMPWTEERLDEELVDIVERFETEKRPSLLNLFEKYPDKKYIVFKSRDQAEEWISVLEKNI